MNKKEKQLKDNKGITLIALVVTIIVLIILAGISINLVLGENGIIQKAKEAKDATEQAQLNEEIALNELMDQWDTLVGGNNAPVVIEGPVEGGSYDNPYIPTGFTHTEGDGTWNSGYTIKDGLGNEFVWVPCVTDATKIKDGDSVELFKKTIEGKYNENLVNLSPTDTSVIDVEPTEAIRTSVGIYGGFYIAKYEAGVPVGEDGNEIAPTSATTQQKARSVSGATAWTNIARVDAIIAAENMIDESSGVKSGLISGECWDTTLKWMVNSSDNASNEPNIGYDLDSTKKGWYLQSNKTTTGQYVINNIYDMGGNVWEWTTENSMQEGVSYIVGRGGGYIYSGSAVPAANRYNRKWQCRQYSYFPCSDL